MNAKSLTRVAAFALLFATSAVAATLDWKGNATSTMWFSPSNWEGDQMPADSLTGDIARFNRASYAFQPNYGATSILGIIVGNGTATTANLTLSGSSLGIGEAGIVMMAKAGNVTVAGSLKLGANQTWSNNSTAAFTVGANVTNSGNATAFTLVSDGSGNTTISGVISDGGAVGTTALSKKGNGTLTLSGANTHNGGTTVSLGKLVLGTGAKLGAATAGLTMGGGQLDLGATSQTVGAVRITAAAGNATATISNGNLTATSYAASPNDGIAIVSARLLGSGNFTKTGNGTVTLSGANGFTGGTTVSQGNLNLSGAGLLGATTSNLTMGGGQLDLGATSQTVAAVRITAAAFGGNATIGNGNLTASSFSANFTAGTAIVTANLRGSGNFTKTGNGTVTLSGVNTYTGGTIVNQGKLALSGIGKLPATSSNLTMAGGQLDLGATNQSVSAVRITAAAAGGNATIGNGNLTATSYSANYTTGSALVSANLLGSGNFAKSGNGTLTFSGANGYTGGTTITQGKLAISGSGKLAASTSNLTLAGGQLDLGGTSQTSATVRITTPSAAGGFTIGNGNLTATSYTANFTSGSALVSAKLLGTAGFSKTGNGTLTLTGANAYSGQTALTAGTLQIGVDSVGTPGSITSGALGRGTLAISAGAPLTSDGTTARTILNPVKLSGTGSPYYIIGDETNNGKLTFRGSVDLGNGPYGYTVYVNSDVQIDGVVSNGGLTKRGVGTLTFTAANTYTAGTNIIEGKLVLSGSATLGAAGSNLTVERSCLDLGGTSQSVGEVNFFDAARPGETLVGNGNLFATSYRTYVPQNSGKTVISANLHGPALLTNDGVQPVCLTGNNTFSGGSYVTSGIVQIGVDSVGSVGAVISGALGTGTLTIEGGTLSSDGSAARTILNPVKLYGVYFDSLQLGDAVNDGKLTFSANMDLCDSRRRLDVHSAVQIDGAISNGGLSKYGGGTLTLTGANTYNYGTRIGEGKLVLGGRGTLGAGISDLFMGGGQLDLGGTTQVVHQVNIYSPPASGDTISNGWLSADSYVADFDSGIAIISANLAGTVAFSKSGSGTVNLAGANSFSGGVTLSSGSLQIGSSSVELSGVLATGALGTGELLYHTGTLSSDGTSPRLILNPVRLVFGTATFGDPTNNGELIFGGPMEFGTWVNEVTTISDVRIDGAISKSDGTSYASLVKLGNGTLTLAGVCNFRDGTTIREGTLALGGSGTIGVAGSMLSLSGGRLDLRGTAQTAGSVSVLAAATAGDTISNGSLTGTSFLLSMGAGSTVISANLLGSAALTKTGNGTVTLTGANTFSGKTLISSGGITLSDANGSLAGDVAVTAGTTIRLNNTASANNSNRLGDHAMLTLSGGTIEFANDGGAANFSESAGILRIEGGFNSVCASQAGEAGTSAFTFASLERTAGFVNFSGAGLGVDQRNRLLFASAPSLKNGLLGVWATCNGGENLATYDPVLGVTAFTGYSDIAARGSELSSQPTSIVRINSPGAGGAIAMGAGTTAVDILVQNGDTPAVLDTAGKTLAASAVLIFAGKESLTIGVAPDGGTLTPDAAGGMLSLFNYSSSALTVNAGIANNAGVTSVETIGNIIFAGTNSYNGSTTIRSGTLTFGGGGAQDVSGIIGGSGSLRKSGSGILILSGNNSYTGGTIISSGRVVASQANSLGIGNVVNNGTLDLTAGAVSYSGLSGRLAGNGTINVTLAQSIANPYNQETTLSGNYSAFTGTWNIGVGNAPRHGYALMDGADNPAARINVLENATLVANRGTYSAPVILYGGEHSQAGQLTLGYGAVWAGSVTLAGDVAGSGQGAIGTGYGCCTISGPIGEAGGSRAFSKSGSGTIILTGNNTYTGGTRIEAGMLRVGNGGTTGNLGAGAVANNGTLAFQRSDTVVQGTDFSSVISGTGSLLQSGPGTLVLSGNNTYSGTTKIEAGTLKLATNLAIQNSVYEPYYYGTLDLTSASSPTFGGLTGYYAFALPANVTRLTLSPQAGSVSYSGSLSGTAAIVKAGAGAQVFSGTNTYNGTTTVSAGVLVVAKTASLPGYNTPAKVSVTGGGTLALTYGGTYDWSSADVGSLLASNGPGFAAGARLGFQTPSGRVVYGNAISLANLGLVKLGAGALALTGNNSHQGGTTLKEGRLEIGVDSFGSPGAIASGALGTGTLTFDGGALSSDGAAPRMVLNTVAFAGSGTCGDATNNGNLIFSAGTDLGGAVRKLTLNSDARFDAAITNGGLSKFGPGSLTLTVANTYSGGTWVEEGRLQVGIGGATGNLGTGPITNNSTLVFFRSNTMTQGTDFTGSIGGTGNLIQSGPGALVLKGNNTYTGTTKVAGGTLVLASELAIQHSAFDTSGTGILDLGSVSNPTFGGLTGNRSLSVPGNVASLTLNTLSGTVTYAGSLGGTPGLFKTGSGTQVLSGTNAYAGTTAVSAGTLWLTKAGSLPGYQLPGKVTVADGAALVLSYGGAGDWSSAEVSALLAHNGAGFSGGSRFGFSAGSVNATYGGDIAGAGLVVTKLGSGALTLTGNNSYDGETGLKEGVLRIGSDPTGTVGAVSSGALGSGPLAFEGGRLSSSGPEARSILNPVVVRGDPALGDATNNGKLTFCAGFDLGGNKRSFTVSSDVQIDGVVGNGGLNKFGPGTLTMSGGNTYSGGTAIHEGVVQIGSDTTGTLGNISAGALGSGLITLNGGALSSDGAAARTILNPVSFGGAYSYSRILLGDAINAGKLTFFVSIDLGNSYSGRNIETLSPVEFAGVVTNGGLNKYGAGTLALKGGNTYSGATFIQEGVVQIGVDSVGSVGAITSSAIGNGVLYFAGGGLSSDGPADRMILNPVTVNGNVTLGDPVNNGKLTFGASARLDRGCLTVNSEVRLDGIVSGGNLTKSGSETLVLGGSNLFSGTTRVEAGTLKLAANLALQHSVFDSSGAGTLDLAATNTPTFGGLCSGLSLPVPGNVTSLTLNTSQDVTALYSGQLGGGFALVKSGGGTQVLSGINSYSGNTTISAGTLVCASPASLPGFATPGRLAAGSGGTLGIAYGGPADWTSAEVDALLANNGAGFAPGSRLGFNTASGNATFGSSITITNLGLTKIGSGALKLTGNNTCAGGTTVNDGVLQIGVDAVGDPGSIASGALGTGMLTLNGGGVSSDGSSPRAILNPVTIGADASIRLGDVINSGKLTFKADVTIESLCQVNVGSSVQFDGVISNGSLDRSGGGILAMNGNNTFKDLILRDGGVLIGAESLGEVGAIASSALGTGSLAMRGGSLASDGPTPRTILNPPSFGDNVTLGDALKNGKLTFAADGDLGNGLLTVNSAVQFDGVLSGAGLIKSGAGTLILAGNNTFAGSTRVNSGTLKLAANLAIQKSAFDTDGAGSLDLASVDNPTFGGLLGSGSPIFPAGVSGLTLSCASGVFAYAGSLNGNFGLIKSGPGTQVLAGANSYSGTTTVSAGTLSLAMAASLPGYNIAGRLAVGTSAAVILNYGGANAWNDSEVTSLLASNGSRFTIGSRLGFQTVNEDATYAGSITNVYIGLAKLGDKTLTISGNHTFNRGTVISEGTLAIAGQGNLGHSSSSLTVGGGRLDLGGTSQTVGWVAISPPTGLGDAISNGNLTGSSYSATINSGTAAVSANLRGTGSLTKSGEGTLKLSGSNTYSGGTTLGSGTLQIGSDPVGTAGAIASSALGTGLLTFTMGTLSSDGNSARTILNPVSLTYYAPVTLGDLVNDGKLTFRGNMTIGGNVGLTVNSPVQIDSSISIGSFSKKGPGPLLLAGTNSLFGTSSVSAGTLLITGSISGSSISVSGGATLGGSGIINNAIAVSANGCLMAGVDEMDFTTLTLGGGIVMGMDSIVKIGLGAHETTHDVLALTASATPSFQANQTFLFLNQRAVPGITYTGILTGLMADPGVGGWRLGNADWSGVFSYNAGSVDFLLLAVPEPSVWTLVGLGFVLLCSRGARCVMPAKPGNR